MPVIEQDIKGLNYYIIEFLSSCPVVRLPSFERISDNFISNPLPLQKLWIESDIPSGFLCLKSAYIQN